PAWCWLLRPAGASHLPYTTLFRSIAGMIIISTFGCNNGLILSGARIYYTMAQDGLFFKKVGDLNRFSVPANGLWIQCVWASLLRSEEHTSELQSRENLVCRLLLEK